MDSKKKVLKSSQPNQAGNDRNSKKKKKKKKKKGPAYEKLSFILTPITSRSKINLVSTKFYLIAIL